MISWVGASRSTQINALFFFQASEGLSCCKEASRDERRAAVHIGVAHGVAERWHLAVTQKRSTEKPKTVSTVAGQKPDASSNKTTPSNADDSTTDDPEPHRVGGKFEAPNKEPSLTVTEVRVVVVGDQSNPEDNSPIAKSPCPSIADNSKESPVNGKDVGSGSKLGSEKSASSESVLKSFLEFCRRKNLDPKSCEVPWINVFLRTLRPGSELEKKSALGCLTKIAEFHNKMVGLYFVLLLLRLNLL